MSPEAPGRACAEPGCPAIVRGSSRCAVHAGNVGRDDRPNANARGYDYEWQKLRAEHIRAHPDCQICGAKCRGVNRIVDHVRPIRGKDDPRRLDRLNLRTNCRKCHARKTAREGRSQS